LIVLAISTEEIALFLPPLCYFSCLMGGCFDSCREVLRKRHFDLHVFFATAEKVGFGFRFILYNCPRYYTVGLIFKKNYINLGIELIST